MLLLAPVLSALSFTAAPSTICGGAQQASYSRAALVAQLPETDEAVSTPAPNVAAAAASLRQWAETESGYKYLDEVIGTGAEPDEPCVVALHYTVSFASGQVIGSSYDKWPLTFALGKHDVPIMADAVRGMRVGGKRRLVVPAHKIPGTQIRNVPKDQAGESLRMEIDFIDIVKGPGAIIPNLLPPGNRRLTITRALFALSFVPYFLPEDQKPEMWRGRSLEEVKAMHEVTANSLWLGGAAAPLDSLFP